MSGLFTTEDRFSMTAEKYLGKHHVNVYLEDCIAQLLEHREENPKINAIKFLSDYFSSVRDGNHTMFREYAFIHSTPHNRASFVRLFWKCYRQIGKKGDLLSVLEYHSLLTLLCPDFPFEPVQKTARIILLDDALDCLISFVDFIYAFQVQFYYEEFFDKCNELYQTLIQMQRSPRDPVVVPSGSDDANVHLNNHVMVDGVEAIQYFRAIYPICDRMNYSTPPVEALKDILFNVPRVSFYGFLMAIAKTERVNQHIGRLPSKSELLEGGDSELTTSSSVSQVVKSPTIRMKGKPRPLSATTPGSALATSNPDTATLSTSNATATQPPTAISSRAVSTSRPSSAFRPKTPLRNGRAPQRVAQTRKESTETESDSDSDDSSDDTN